MSSSEEVTFALVEQLLLQEFREVPFHNLFYLGLCHPSELLKGGTCSDKVMAFQTTLTQQGISSRPHTSMMPNWNNPEADLQDYHRVLVIEIEGERYFADVGNGWPSIHLFSFEHEIHYNAFGIEFQSQITPDYVDIYQVKKGKRTLSQRVPRQLVPESLVLDAIKNRFNTGNKYPFSKGLRFAQVINDEFLFLKNNHLKFYYQSGKMDDIELPSWNDQIDALDRFFGLNIALLGLRDTPPGYGYW